MNNAHSIQNPFLNALDVILCKIQSGNYEAWKEDSLEKLTDRYKCNIEILDEAIEMVQDSFISVIECSSVESKEVCSCQGGGDCQEITSLKKAYDEILDDLIYVRKEMLP